MAVGDHHYKVGPVPAQGPDDLGIAQGRGLKDRQPGDHCRFLDRTGGESAATAGGTVRLGIDGPDVLSRVDQGV